MQVTLTRALSTVAAVLCWALATVLVGDALQTPGHVEVLRVDNPHDWAVNVQVSDAARSDWVGLGDVDRGDAHTFEEVLDQGDTWVVRFAYAGNHADLELTRTDLDRSDWQITVPDEIATTLRRAGVPETPRH